MFYVIDYLKAIACLLIMNFHSDIIYPDKLSILAFGGDIGNNIFFAISGFTLFSSINRSKFTDIFLWYGKRLLKLLPILAVFYLCSVLFGFTEINNVQQFIHAFIFPTLYWFTGAILIFYPLLFIFGKIKGRFTFYVLAVILIGLHFLIGGVVAERYIMGFLAMLAGYTLRVYLSKKQTTQFKAGIPFLIALICTFLGYIGGKLLYMKGIECFGIVKLFVGLMTVLMALLLIYWGYVKNERLRVFSEKHKWIYRFFHLMSQITLSVYLVQGFGDRIIIQEIIKYTPFPLSYLICTVIVVIIAWLITKVDSLIRLLFQKRRVK